MIGNASTALGNLFAGLRLTSSGAKQGGEAGAIDFGSVVAGLGQPEGGEQAAILLGDAGVVPGAIAVSAAPVDGLSVEGAPTAANDEAAAPELLSLIEQLQGKPVAPPTILPVAEGLPAGNAAPVSPETLLPAPVKGKKLLAVEPTELLAEGSVEVTRGGVISTENESAADSDEADADPIATLAVQADVEPAPAVVALSVAPTIIAPLRAGRTIYTTAAPAPATPADRAAPSAQPVPTQPAAAPITAAATQAVDFVLPGDQALPATAQATPVAPAATPESTTSDGIIWEPVPARPIFAAAAFAPPAPLAVDQNGAVIAPPVDQPVTVPVDVITATAAGIEPSGDSAATQDAAAPAAAPARTDSLLAMANQPAPTPAVVASPAPVVDLQAISAATVPANTDMTQQVIGHHLDLARDSAWLDQLARDIVSAGANDAKLQFKLNPEHLGSLHVELIRGGDGASVRMTTETEAARSALSDAQGRLIAEARAQGMKITETHVDLSQQGGRDQGQRGWADGQSGQSQSQPQSSRVNATVTMKALDAELADRRAASHERYA
ncbi:hypothetical protein ACFB49_34590 [Sphingomonas sp. DBB INV C78]|uniref:flagellar hook-length control protein FliK n=1 Tax=Sphingomonas sp. DBB INV C78 TaxID=3349434 RepID=UPI0036D42F36